MRLKDCKEISNIVIYEYEYNTTDCAGAAAEV